jgi:hypothetical protein
MNPSCKIISLTKSVITSVLSSDVPTPSVKLPTPTAPEGVSDMRKVMFLLSAIMIVTLVIISGVLKAANQTTEAVSPAKSSVVAAPVQSEDPPGTIDGSVTPQLIPDDVAYELFFNFFSNRAAGERAKLQAYCNQTTLASVGLDSIFAAAAHYQQLVAPIDAQAQAIRDSNPHATAQDAALVNAQLAPLQTQRKAVVTAAIAKLVDFVGPAGAVAIRQHIDGRIKCRTKILPGPSMPLNGITPGADLVMHH